DATRRYRLPRREVEQITDTLDGRVPIRFGIFRKQLMRLERTVRPARDDVRKRAAAVDPEFPSLLRTRVQFGLRPSFGVVACGLWPWFGLTEATATMPWR